MVSDGKDVHDRLKSLFEQMEKQLSTVNESIMIDENLLKRIQDKSRFHDHEIESAQSLLAAIGESLNNEIQPLSSVTETPMFKNAAEAWQFYVSNIAKNSLENLLLCQIQTNDQCEQCLLINVSWSFVWQLSLDLGIIEQSTPNNNNVATLAQCLINGEQIRVFGCQNCGPNQSLIRQKFLCRVSPCLVINLHRGKLVDQTTGQCRLMILVDERIKICGQMYVIIAAILLVDGKYLTMIRENDQRWVIIDNDQIDYNITHLKATEYLSYHACVLLYNGEYDDSELLSAEFKALNLVDQSLQQQQQQQQQQVPHSTVLLDKRPVKNDTITNQEVKSISNLGLCGLRNLGLTCYANSCIQALYTINRIRRNIIEHQSKGQFHHSLGELLKRMEIEASTTNRQTIPFTEPESFLRLFRTSKPMFRERETADAQEFLTILLEMIHQEANKAGPIMKQCLEPKTRDEAWQYQLKHVDNSYLSNLLMGQIESTLMCNNCSNQSMSWSCFWQLQLQIDSVEPLNSNRDLTLVDCIADYTAKEQLTGDCSPQCSQCKDRQPATKWSVICRLPHFLVIHLKRFTYDGRKLYRRVLIPERVMISEQSFVINSVVLHRGSETFGHNYTLFRETGGQWFDLDDDDVRKLSTDIALEQLHLYAYLCIYRISKKGNASKPQVVKPTRPLPIEPFKKRNNIKLI
ncbi:hypothetical protein RDWZM_002169 [Blomia tropicalis]|uniref:ubiquitinyl hydrolase 1 n=1 Tax=Blomia tropicalis TaxID=40697 RepID=A0A9Q0MDU5_BLOTA|nr:hypothetical protein RDWZM_002169 [Blomia tropicalis]